MNLIEFWWSVRWRVILGAVVIAALHYFTHEAKAADRAILASEQEVAALVGLIDDALKAKGVSVAQNAVYWLNKIHAAPIVTDRKDEPASADKPKDPPQ